MDWYKVIKILKRLIISILSIMSGIGEKLYAVKQACKLVGII